MHHRATSLTNFKTHPSLWVPASPPVHEGHSQQSILCCSQAVSPVTLYSCSDTLISALAFLPRPMSHFALRSGTSHKQTLPK